SLYKPEYVKQAKELALLGLIDEEMAGVFGVSVSKFYEWKKQYPEFMEALKEGKVISDAKVSQALFSRACGYSHDDVHISNYQGQITITPIKKHYPPDVAACFIWLKNRQGKLWKDKTDDASKGGVDLAEALTRLADKLPD
ncbi:MAG: hypothetical protein K2Q45_01935, partial [Nitrosomonas sp.]|nr:hypothetical protein [Nitrosomonas sp.]